MLLIHKKCILLFNSKAPNLFKMYRYVVDEVIGVPVNKYFRINVLKNVTKFLHDDFFFIVCNSQNIFQTIKNS